MWATLVLVLIAISFWLLVRFSQVLFMLMIAIVLGTIIRPAVTWLHQQGLPRKSGVLLVYLLLLTLLIGFGLMLFPVLVEQGTTIVASLPGYYQTLRAWSTGHSNPAIVRLSGFLPATPTGLSPPQQTGQQMLASAEQALGYLGSAAKVVLVATAVLLMAYHWTLDGPRTIRSLLLLVPKAKRETLAELLSAMETKVGSYVAGQGVLCLAVGFLALIAYVVIGLPNALVLALMAGMLEAVPMIGPLLGALPAAVVALSIGPSKLIWVIVATLLIQLAENSLLVPRVMRRAVGVNPFVSLLAIFALGTLLGPLGVLMAIPMAAVVQLILDRFVFHSVVLEAEMSTGRNHISRLRYETQDLARDLRKQARLKKTGSDLRVRQIDQVMDEIETLATDLDALLAQVEPSDTP
jgi:predicted PurR-regulated permease PerM